MYQCTKCVVSSVKACTHMWMVVSQLYCNALFFPNAAWRGLMRQYQDNCCKTNTHIRGNSSGSAPFRWKNPSTKIPFFPLHTRKNLNDTAVPDDGAPSTQKISRWLRETKLDRPMSMSTSPLLLLRPIVARRLRIVNSKSRPSSRARATPRSSPAGDHDIDRRAAGLDGADRSANNA